MKFELLLHAPYLSDLARSDYFLFPDLKKLLSGKRFTKERVSVVDACVEELYGSHYKQGIEASDPIWEKYTTRKGDYIKK